jgi:hypothetical protein
MDAYIDLVVLGVLMEEHKLSKEVAFDLVRRNRQRHWKQEKDLKSILAVWQ